MLKMTISVQCKEGNKELLSATTWSSRSPRDRYKRVKNAQERAKKKGRE